VDFLRPDANLEIDRTGADLIVRPHKQGVLESK